MRTVVLGDHHPELTEWIARRRALGHDRHDEVWDGEYHMARGSRNFYHGIARRPSSPSCCGQLAHVAWTRASGQSSTSDCTTTTSASPTSVLHRDLVPSGCWVPTAAMVVEVVSPDDESWLKFDHYAAHGVDEVLIADPRRPHPRTCSSSPTAGTSRRDHSPLLGVAVRRPARSHRAGPGPNSAARR